MADQPKSRLDGWKAIAAYLGCEPKTAQRWSKSRGLPIKRIPGGLKSSVYAYREDLDSWLHSEDDSPADATAAASAQPPPSRRRFITAAASVASLATGGLLLSKWRATPGPDSVKLNGRVVTGYDLRGNGIWDFELPEPPSSRLRESFESCSACFSPVGSPGRWVFISASYADPQVANLVRRSEFILLRPDGQVQWRRDANPGLLDFDGREFHNHWDGRGAFTAEAGQRTWLFGVTACIPRWASCVLRFSLDGETSVQFANAGHIQSFCRVASQPEAPVAAIGGVNNAYQETFVALMDLSGPPVISPPGGPERYKYSNGPTRPSGPYALIPATEIHKAVDTPYGHVLYMNEANGLLTVEVSLSPSNRLAFEFDSANLRPVVSRAGGGVLDLHDKLTAGGGLNHPTAKCPMFAKPFPIRLWNGVQGWTTVETPWALRTNKT